jgi:hypothetical protein
MRQPKVRYRATELECELMEPWSRIGTNRIQIVDRLIPLGRMQRGQDIDDREDVDATRLDPLGQRVRWGL